jgi:hypothetical protein
MVSASANTMSARIGRTNFLAYTLDSAKTSRVSLPENRACKFGESSNRGKRLVWGNQLVACTKYPNSQRYPNLLPCLSLS